MGTDIKFEYGNDFIKNRISLLYKCMLNNNNGIHQEVKEYMILRIGYDLRNIPLEFYINFVLDTDIKTEFLTYSLWESI